MAPKAAAPETPVAAVPQQAAVAAASTVSAPQTARAAQQPAQAALTSGLPLSVVSPVDLGRLIRELQAIDEFLRQSAIRQDSEVKMPKTSKLMDETIQLNRLDLLREADRGSLAALLEGYRKHSPVLHISFSADPAPLFVNKMMFWLRQEIDPAVLLTIGLQPSMGAGCMVRTTNKYFDFSLRATFESKQDLLLAKLREAPE